MVGEFEAPLGAFFTTFNGDIEGFIEEFFEASRG